MIGITGGIASGKSHFCGLLAILLGERAETFDADACAHELLADDPEVRRRVTDEIHLGAYDEEGGVNRSLLRETIFQDPTKRRRLEEILHPRIRKLWTEQGRVAKNAGRYFLVEIPLLFETHAGPLFDRIVTVASSRETQRQRLIKTRHLKAKTVEQIIASQMPWEEKLTRSHHVVWNDGSLEAFDAQTKFFAKKIA